jgi:hypothetical protein
VNINRSCHEWGKISLFANEKFLHWLAAHGKLGWAAPTWMAVPVAVRAAN